MFRLICFLAFLGIVQLHPKRPELAGYRVRARASLELATLYSRQGRREESAAELGRARAIIENMAPHPDLNLLWLKLGNVYRDSGRYADAESAFKKAVDIARNSSDTMARGRTLSALGEHYRDIGDYASAKRLFREALPLLEPRERGSEAYALSIVLANLAHIEAVQGHVAQARRWLQEAARRCSSLRHRHWKADVVLRMSHAQEWLGEKDAAAASLKQALALLRDAPFPRRAPLLLHTANLEWTRGHAEAAVRLYEEVIGGLTSEPDSELKAQAFSDLAEIRRQSGDIAGAERLFLQAQEILDRFPGRLKTITNLWRLAKLYRTAGREAEAQKLLVRALALAKEVGSPKLCRAVAGDMAR